MENYELAWTIFAFGCAVFLMLAGAAIYKNKDN